MHIFFFFLFSERAARLRHFFLPLFYRIQIGKRELHIDRFDIAFRVDRHDGIRIFADVHDIGIVKTANDVCDARRLPDIRQKLIAETLALSRAFNKTCDIDNLYRRRRNLFRLKNACEKSEVSPL